MKGFENYKVLCNIIINIHCELTISLFNPQNIILRLGFSLILQEKKSSLMRFSAMSMIKYLVGDGARI